MIGLFNPRASALRLRGLRVRASLGARCDVSLHNELFTPELATLQS